MDQFSERLPFVHSERKKVLYQIVALYEQGRRRYLGAAVAASFLTGCASAAPPLPPDRVTGANYALIASGMTKGQVFTILGAGSQQSETTMNGMTLENYVWMPRDNPYAQVLVTFKDGREMSKVKVGL